MASVRASPPDWPPMAGIWPCPYGARTTTAWDLSASRTTLSSSTAELRQLGRKVELELVPAELEDPVAATRLVLRAEEQLGPLAALVMSHSEGVNSVVLDTTVASFDRHYAVNVRAAWLLLAAFAQQLPPGGWLCDRAHQ